MTTLRDDLDRHAARFDPAPEAFEAVLRRAEQRRTRRRVTAGVVGALLTAVALTNVWWAFGRGPSAPVTSPHPTTTPAGAAPGLRIGLTTERGIGFNVAASSGSAWVQGAQTLVEIDPLTGRVRGETRDGADYDYTALAATDDGVVVASGSTVRWFLDGTEGSAVIEGVAVDVEILDGAAWVLSVDVDNELWRIDLETGDASRLTSLGHPLDVTDTGGALAAGEGALWVATTGGMLRVDPSSETAVVLADGADPVVAGGSVWVMAGERRLVAIDPRSGRERSEVQLDEPVARLAGEGNHVWVLTQTGSTSDAIYLPDPDRPATVVLIDATSGALLSDPVPLPEALPAGFAAADGHAWVAFHQTGRVYRIDMCALPCGGASS